MSSMEIYLALVETPGVMSLIFAVFILFWAYGVERKKYIGISVCVFFWAICSLVGAL